MTLPVFALTCLEKAGKDGVTGYDIKKIVTEHAHTWSASHQQIYRELTKLHKAGLCAFETVPQTGKPDRKVYRINKAGQAYLAAELCKIETLKTLRDGLAVKIMACDALNKPYDAQIRLHVSESGERLKWLSEQKEKFEDDPLALALIDRQSAIVRADIKWGRAMLGFQDNSEPVEQPEPQAEAEPA